jgi:phosphate transport system substrate-binding protein
MWNVVVAVLFVSVGALSAAPSLKIQGSTTVNPVVVEAAEGFRSKGWKIVVDTQGGSSGGVSSLGEGLVDIGMISKPVSPKDRERFSKVNFRETEIGYDGVALVVSKHLYDEGLQALTKEQIQAIYESKARNWKDVGGPDLPVVFFNKEPGRGTWEVFAHFLYSSSEKSPSVTHPEVGGNEEGRTKVAQHKSAVTQLSASWAEGDSGVRALGIKLENGKTVLPTRANILGGQYPMRRYLAVITNGEPKGPAKEFIDYLLSPVGQKLVEKHGYLAKIILP